MNTMWLLQSHDKGELYNKLDLKYLIKEFFVLQCLNNCRNRPKIL